MRRSSGFLLATAISLSLVAWFPAAGPARAAFPGTNGLIAFANGEVVATMNPDGSGVTAITPASQDLFEPAWDSTGTKLVMTGYNGQDDLFTMNADGSGLTRITNTPQADEINAGWSPDGTQVVYERQELSGPHVGQSQIWVANADGSNPTRLTSDGFDHGPVWSPDGTRIAFFNNSTGSNIMTMNPDGTGLIRLTGKGINSAPSWSPDGSRIVFVRGGATTRIWSMASDGTDPRQLTTDAGVQDWNPAYSPDGTQIVFTRNIGIWTMAADGSGLTEIFDSIEWDDWPDWQPLP
jgi:Tol biopolymer transport system component